MDDRQAPAPVQDVAVDGLVSRLSDLEERHVDDHVAVFEDLHTRLRSALDAPGTPEYADAAPADSKD